MLRMYSLTWHGDHVTHYRDSLLRHAPGFGSGLHSPVLHATREVAHEMAERAAALVQAKVHEEIERWTKQNRLRPNATLPHGTPRSGDFGSGHACLTEYRLAEATANWGARRYRDGESGPDKLVLEFQTEVRFRFMPIEQETTINKDGTTTIVHRLGKPVRAWTKWRRHRDGVLRPPVPYLPLWIQVNPVIVTQYGDGAEVIDAEEIDE